MKAKKDAAETNYKNEPEDDYSVDEDLAEDKKDEMKNILARLHVDDEDDDDEEDYSDD